MWPGLAWGKSWLTFGVVAWELAGLRRASAAGHECTLESSSWFTCAVGRRQEQVSWKTRVRYRAETWWFVAWRAEHVSYNMSHLVNRGMSSSWDAAWLELACEEAGVGMVG